MKSIPHIFPHAYLPGPAIKRLVSFFGPVRIYQPWFISTPEILIDNEIEAVNPPVNLKPKEDFKAILSGYRLWAGQNHDRTYREIMKFSDKSYQDDDATWEIRRLLRGSAQQTSAAKEEDLALKRHLLLHLAHEIERNNFDLRDMMNALKDKGPVLKGVLQDPGETKGIFDHMAGLGQSDIPDNLNMGLVLDAWFGLFSGYLNEGDLLITFNNHVMEYLFSKWDEKIDGDKEAAPLSISFRLPAMSLNDREGDDKTGINLHETVRKISEMIPGITGDPARRMIELQALTREIEDTFPWVSAKGVITITMKYFSSMSRGGSFDDKDLLRHIAGKAMALVLLP
jgi:hypothetical protein